MFEDLTRRLDAAFKGMLSRGVLTEADVDAGLREVRLALLEADVNFKVARDFIARALSAALLSVCTRTWLKSCPKRCSMKPRLATSIG